MTALTLLDEPRRVGAADDAELALDAGVRRPAQVPADGGGPSLDEVIASVWEGLTAGRPASCPVCAGTMVPRYGAGSAAVGGRCGDCGSALA